MSFDQSCPKPPRLTALGVTPCAQLASQSSGSALIKKVKPDLVSVVVPTGLHEAVALELIDIQLKKPTLEDVFIELTGKRLRD